MNQSKIDTNIDNYTLPELLTILELDTPNEENVLKSTNYYIKKFKKEGNKTMEKFFQDVQDNLLTYVEGLDSSADAEYTPTSSQSTLWWNNQNVLPQPDQVQRDKITNRTDNTETFNNNHLPMSQKQLGVTNIKNVEVAQDKLNPNLTNTTSRVISLDSQYRQVTGINDTSTDYTLDLSEPLVNVLSLRPYSIQVPYTWYVIDTPNTCFFITFSDNISVTVSLEAGNYSSTTFVTALINSFTDAGFTFSTTPVTFNSNNGKITLSLYGGTYTDSSTSNTYTVDETTVITFFDPTNTLACSKYACSPPSVINQTLGWLMGYRLPYINVNSDGNVASAVINLIGPKYLIVVLDDLNQNHINSGLIGITELSKTLKLPSYYSRDLPYVCTPANPYGNNLESNTELLGGDDINAGRLIMDKWNASYVPNVTVLPSAPRILTQSQIYSINEIMKNNERYSNYTKTSSPTCSDTFAILPLGKKNMNTGDLYVEDSSTLQLNKRIYFGPVNIERMRLKLLDDKGNVLNLNGGDWCMTIIAELLYQY